MSILEELMGKSPFARIATLAQKVHQCVSLVRPMVEALFNKDFEKLDSLHHDVAKTEYEADILKNDIRRSIQKKIFLSLDRADLLKMISLIDDVADSAEDFSVVLEIRRTDVAEQIKPEFQEFVDQVLKVSDKLLNICEQLAVLAESSFAGKEADYFLNSIEEISEEEWKADKLQRKFAKKYYSMEKDIDPTTLRFYDKYCLTLSQVANASERTAKFIRQIVLKK